MQATPTQTVQDHGERCAIVQPFSQLRRNRVIRPTLGGSCDAEQFPRAHPIGGMNGREHRLAKGHCARLIEEHRINIGQRLHVHSAFDD